MYFISRFYRSIKFTFASLGAIGSSLAIIYGALQSGGTVFIIGGSIGLANSLFNFWETGKVSADILKQVNNLNDRISQFADQNEVQKENIEKFNEVKKDMVKRNTELQKTIGELTKKLGNLEHSRQKSLELQEELSKNLDLEKEQIVVLGEQNDELKYQLSEMDKVKDTLKSENEEYQKLLIEAHEQIEELDDIVKKIKEERDELSENNALMNEQIMKQIEIIRESKELIVSLSQFGDKYQQFSSTIDTNLIKMDSTQESLEEVQEDLEQTANVLKQLIENLKGKTFTEMDQNQDGYITQEEFQAALEKL